jgi:hypothetical protein
LYNASKNETLKKRKKRKKKEKERKPHGNPPLKVKCREKVRRNKI